MRDMTPIGIYRLIGRKATRAFTETQLVDKISIMQVIEPLWTAPTPVSCQRQFSCMLRW